MVEQFLAGVPLILSAGEAGRKFDLLSPDPGLIFWTVLTFLGLLFLLRKTAWGPIIDGLERREERIRNSLAEAEKARDDGQRLLAQQQEELTQARQEAQKIIEQGTSSAKVMQEEILAKAKSEAVEMVESARREIRLETEKARDELRAEVVDISIAVAGKLLQRSLQDDDHQRLASEFMSELDKTR